MLPLKQGLKHGYACTTGYLGYVAKMLPLKQGLKPVVAGTYSLPVTCCKDASTKTRIETCQARKRKKCYYLVAKMLPLKQGLKLLRSLTAVLTWTVAKMLPLKQGLKRSSRLSS